MVYTKIMTQSHGSKQRECDIVVRNLNNFKFANANFANVDLSDVTSGGIAGTPALPTDEKLMKGYLVGPKNNSWDHITAITTGNASSVRLRGYAKNLHIYMRYFISYIIYSLFN